MTRQKQQRAILVVLVVVMSAIYTRALRTVSPPARHVQDQPAVHESTSPSANVALVRQEPVPQRESQHQRALLLAWRRDPFTRGAIGEVSGLTLSGILWDANAPIAIINGQMVHVGEELEGYHVTEITQEHVSITDGTQTFQLKIAP